MSERKKTIFISCGQSSEPEKALGNKVAELVRKLTPFDAYFAENQSDVKGVTESILARLHDSIGFIAIMHHRGTVSGIGGTFTRASVWIEQEIAIAAFMGQILNRPLRTVSYYERGIQLEGVRQFIILNPKPFTTSDEVLKDLETVLPTWVTPLYENLTSDQREAIKRKINVTRINALHPNLTLWLKNRSDSDIFVRSAGLFHKEKRLNRAVPTDNRDTVEVRAHNEGTVIAFMTDDDAASKLKSWGAVDPNLAHYGHQDNVEIEVRIEYVVGGVEEECSEKHAVRVHGTRTIELR